MKIVFAIAALLAVAAAKPSGILAPLAYAPIIPYSLSSQYHAQDALGQYSYGYANDLSAKTEVKSIDGVTRGGYTYVDAEGKLQSVQYTSDAVAGFRVAATNLPVAPSAPKVEPLPEPVPVKDTPEVAEAKAQHLAAVEEAKVKAAEPVAVMQSAPFVAAPYYGVSPVLAYSAYNYGYPFVYSAPWVAAPVVVAPADTPEVAQAKAEHLAAVEEVKARDS
ncbi:Chitin bind 4 domain containing protein [Asbolus verrucosus]|uniref:Chitin bind 4 domain containing protein n=1 Tax=Asbolus verrucosus TaxID=1661398 RepID=A0A482VGM2_ASBVE|nr:Chitin bind 4 domain containing protein [Asbolus verrucosus]